jgi:iron complex outermembrane recepter protein
MKTLLLTASMLAMVAVSPALARSVVADSSDVATEERDTTIIVTARGRPRSSAELISNTTALNRTEIVATLAPTLGDTLDSQPGVSSSSFGQGASRPILRGLGAERVLVLTNGIGVIDASSASPDHQVTADGIDATRVEIMRGPAALAYGGQAIGGVVNVLDGYIGETRGEGGFSGELLGATNSVNRGNEVAVRGGLSQGGFVATFGISERSLGDFAIPGYAESARLIAAEGDEHDAEDATRDRLPNSFVDTASTGFGLSWVGERGYIGIARRNQTSQYGLPGHGHHHEEDPAMAGPVEEEAPFIDLDQTRTEVRGRLSFAGGLITAVDGGLVLVDYTHSEIESPGGPAGTIFNSDGWEARLDATTAFAGWSGAVGLAARDSSLEAEGDEAFLTNTDVATQGIFVFQEKEWANRFGVEGGLRLERTELVNDGGGTRDFDLMSASLGVHQHVGDAWFFGAQISHTQRAPKEFELFANGPHLATEQYEVGDRTLDAETGTNFELAVRYNSGPFALDASVYAINFSDFIYLSPGTVVIGEVTVDEVDHLPVVLFRQTDADFTGAELSARWNPQVAVLGAEWSFKAGVDWVSGSLKGAGDVPFLPPVTVSLETTAQLDKIGAGANLTIAGDQDRPGEGYLATDGYTALDLNLSYSFGPTGQSRFFIEGRNVTDEEIRFATSVLKDLVPQPGRNIRAGVRLVF